MDIYDCIAAPAVFCQKHGSPNSNIVQYLTVIAEVRDRFDIRYGAQPLSVISISKSEFYALYNVFIEEQNKEYETMVSEQNATVS